MTAARRRRFANGAGGRARHRRPAIGRSRTAAEGEARHSEAAIALRELVEKSLAEGKAQEIVAIDLVGKSTMADFMVVASGGSQRQINALTDRLRAALKKGAGAGPTIEGEETCDWVLIDAGDVIVHLFRPEVRAFYNIEKMWTVDLPPEQLAV